MIPNYILDKEDAEYDYLSNDMNMCPPQTTNDTISVQKPQKKKHDENLGKTAKPQVNTLFGPDPLNPSETLSNSDKVGIGSMLKNKMSNAMSIFGGTNSKRSRSSSEESSEEEKKHKPTNVQHGKNKQPIIYQNTLIKAKSLPVDDVKYKSKTDSLSDEKKVPKTRSAAKIIKEPKKTEFTSCEDAQMHLKETLSKNHDKIKAMIDTQISKWESIQTKRENEQKLKIEIQNYEKEVLEATQSDDFDLAEHLQTKIDKTTKELEKNRDYRFELEEKTKEIKSFYLKDIKDNISALIVSESKLESQKGIYNREETRKINDQSEEILSQNTKLETNETDLILKLEESRQNLKNIEEKVSKKAKEHIETKNELDSKITKVDTEIAELERLLKLKIDEKHALEEEREDTVNIIKEITSGLDDRKYMDEVEKYERKLMVNSERKEAILQEQEKLTENKLDFAEQMKDLDKKIVQFSTLAKNMKDRLRKQESEFEIFDSVIKEYERKF
jgi:hypothetical protein